MEILVLMISALLLASVTYLIWINKKLREERDLYKKFYHLDRNYLLAQMALEDISFKASGVSVDHKENQEGLVVNPSQELIREEYKKILETVGKTLVKRHQAGKEIN